MCFSHGKNKNFSRSEKSQEILPKVRETLSSYQNQYKVEEFKADALAIEAGTREQNGFVGRIKCHPFKIPLKM